MTMIFNDTLLCRFVGCDGGKQGWNKTEEILGEFSLHPSSNLEGEMPLVLFWILFLGQGVFLFQFIVFKIFVFSCSCTVLGIIRYGIHLPVQYHDVRFLLLGCGSDADYSHRARRTQTRLGSGQIFR